MNQIKIERCPCGKCSDWHLIGIGKFCQRSGFKKDEAEFICKAVNCHDELLEALKDLEHASSCVASEDNSANNNQAEDLRRALVQARAMLARAEGGE